MSPSAIKQINRMAQSHMEHAQASAESNAYQNVFDQLAAMKPSALIDYVGHVNSSGIYPTEFKVLIEPKAVETKIGSIIIPDSTQEKKEYAQIEGQIIAISHLAFTYASPEEWGDKRPKPGDRILYAKYAGVRVKGRDGKDYVLANDKDICATIEE